MSTSLFRRIVSTSRPPRISRSRPLTTPVPPPVPPTSSRIFRALRAVSAVSTIALATYTFGALYPPTPFTYISPRAAPPPPDPDHPDSHAYLASLEEQLHALPLLARHRIEGTDDVWYETRPYLSLPEERRANNLTAGALRGPGKLAMPPLVRARKDESESWIFIHVGRGLCGHDGIVHGGLLATLLDEGLARVAIMNLPEKIGVTAKLCINYRAPTRADQFIVLKTRLVELKGRKAIVSGTVEDMDGTVLVEATATFVQPKYAKLLSSSSIHQAMGEPQPKTEVVEVVSIQSSSS
ncbi:hypothetical protein EW146_g2220 [Bondarzewia mesenterica]|uniref:Thioesterase domain-containing protein n=1 Tax=Bondarzewia mesenterica TaxID=1095465 RepID=A0A4S4M362_9AGAM|nr:hypothetical protein EW146_g2220 [Bondarzewia mesenterica]